MAGRGQIRGRETAATTRSTGIEASAAESPGRTPTAARKASETFVAVAGSVVQGPAADIVMARRNRPRASGTPMRVAMLLAPADDPNTVTLSGSPPKAAMLS